MANEEKFVITLDIDGQVIKADYDTIYSGLVGALKIKLKLTNWAEETTVLRFMYGEDEPMERDMAYQAYKKMYERMAQKSHDDMLGRVAARNGGAMSSAAQLAAAASYNEQMQMLSDRIPELQQMAYNRWLNDRNARLDAVTLGEGNAYNRYAVGSDSGNTAYNRFNEWQDRETARKYEPLKMRNAESEARANEIATESAEQSLKQQTFEDAYARAIL